MSYHRWRQFARRGMAALLPRRRFLVSGPPDCSAVCLTFDDGPHPELTPRLLDLLKDQEVPATFFVIGRMVERHPEIVRRMAAEGHAVGNHSYSHSDPSRTSARCLVREVRRTCDLLAEILGHPPSLFRPPHGKLTPAKLLGLWSAGQTVVLWNADSKDYACRSSDEVLNWCCDHPPRGGDIVLMHDDHPHAVAVMPELVLDARRRGLTFSTLDSWVS